MVSFLRNQTLYDRGENMNFFGKIFKSKPLVEEKYSSDLERLLVENKIPYDIDEQESCTRIAYIDPFDKVIYEFQYIDGELLYNKRPITEKEALRLMESKWKSDELIIQYLEDEKYNELFEISDFFKDITSENGLIEKFVPIKGKGIRLYYNIGNVPTEKDFIAGIQLSASSNGTDYFEIIPSGMQVNANGAVLEILKKIYDEAPLFFTSGSYRVNQNNKFADIVKTYLINLAVVNRLNEIDGIEAQITDAGRNNIIFVMFKNGSALEYISPTKQAPNGKLLIIDFDEENLAEDNDNFKTVSKILKLPSMIRDKPDEKNMPTRSFTK